MLIIEYHTTIYAEEEDTTIDIVSTLVVYDKTKAVLLGLGSNNEVVILKLDKDNIIAYDTNLGMNGKTLPVGSRADVIALLSSLDVINRRNYKENLTKGNIEHVIGTTGIAHEILKIFNVKPKTTIWDEPYFLIADADRVYKHLFNNTVDDIKDVHTIMNHDELEEELAELHRDSVVTELDVSSIDIAETLYS